MSSRQRAGNRPARGFTLIELLIVIAVISILVTVVVPVLWVARGMVGSYTCMSNMRQLSMAMLTYSHDNKGNFPGNANDPVKNRWLVISGGPDIFTQKVGGVIGKYIEFNQRMYSCPEYKGQDELGGDTVACHYSSPTVLSGMPVGQAQQAYYHDPVSSTAEADRRLLRGVPVLFEPLVRRLSDDTFENYLGVYNKDTRKWTTLPDGAFEQDDKIACRRHIGQTNVGFHDGHAETVTFPDPEIRAQNFYLVISTTTGSKRLHMGGTNSFDSWFNRSN